MRLYLQMGHGMQSMAEEMIKFWGKGDIILSPVNMNQDKIKGYSDKIRTIGGNILFDPQLFFPKDGNEKLKLYDYWPLENATISSNRNQNQINKEILKLNNILNCSELIIPGKEMNNDYLHDGISWIKASAKYYRDRTEKPLLATLCLYPEVIRDINVIEYLVSKLKDLPVDGFYIVPHPSNKEYIVSDAIWVIGMMKLISCIKLMKKKVIVGYSNHQGLIYALANVDGIASGNWMNTRSFVPGKFKALKSDMRQKSTWYYLPSALCEYKATLLDVAFQRGILDRFRSEGYYNNKYSEILFNGARPSSTNYKEPNSFKHYLYCLNRQCALLTKNSYDEAYSLYEFMLNVSEKEMKDLKMKGLSGQNRDFLPGLDANRIAMISNNEDYGLKLKFEWKNI